GGAAALGALLFVAMAPGAGRAAAFWHPFRTLADTRTPVRLVVDKRTVRRGDSVTVTIDVRAATRATLWTRGPGEPWRPAPVTLDALGHAVRRLGPLQADLYVRAASGGRRSADGAPLEGDTPELRLTVVRDSAPVVAVPVPGRDTTLPLSLRQPLVIDARDDHGLTRLEVLSWRVSQTGKVGETVRESLD